MKLFENRSGAFELLTSNDNWGGASALSQKFAELGQGALARDSKDAALYPLVWRAYDTQGGRDPGPCAGTTGVARQRLEPSGYIEVCGELWRAELTGSAKAVEAGRTVKVTGREGLTLFVEPEDHHQ